MNAAQSDDWTRNGARAVCGLALAIGCAAGVLSTARFVDARETLAMPVSTGVDVNTARAPELELLPGIGPALSGGIVAERDAGGRFRTIDELTRVRGIGERRVMAIEGHAVVRD